MSVEIPLRRRDGTVRAVAIVDDEDADLAGERWHLLPGGGVRKSDNAYAVRWKDSRRLFVHREILARVLGRAIAPGEQGDHVDGNRMNNRRKNLRVATHSQNQRNRKSVPGASSLFLGVWWDSRRSKWEAKIQSNRHRIWLGYHDTEEDAALAYNRAATELHGDFARLNVLDGGGA